MVDELVCCGADGSIGCVVDRDSRSEERGQLEAVDGEASSIMVHTAKTAPVGSHKGLLVS